MSKRLRWLSLATLTALLTSLALTGVVAAQERPDDGDNREEGIPYGGWDCFAPWSEGRLRCYSILPDDKSDWWEWWQRELERYGLQIPFGHEFRFELPVPDLPQVTPWFDFEFQCPGPLGFHFEVHPGKVIPFLMPKGEMHRPRALILGYGGMQGILLDKVAEALNMTPSALLGALLDGQSVAEIAEAQGVDLDEVVAVLLAPLRERIAQAVANGCLSEEEGDDHLAEAEEHIRAVLTRPLPSSLLQGMKQRVVCQQLVAARQAMIESAADALGLTPDEYRHALQGDSTLWQLAEEAGVTRAEILQAARRAFDAAVQQLVDDGLLTEAEGEVIKERLTDKAIERLLSGGQKSQVKMFQVWPPIPML